MAISDGTTASARGFLGTITGLVQETVDQTNGARSITKVKGELNETAEVVIADPFVELGINAVMLASFSSTIRMGTTLTYNSVNYCVQAARKTRTAKFHNLNMTLRKEGSMTYTVA